jgi:hypothetical protein
MGQWWGLVATLGAARLGMAQVQEIRDALLAFRKFHRSRPRGPRLGASPRRTADSPTDSRLLVQTTDHLRQLGHVVLVLRWPSRG